MGLAGDLEWKFKRMFLVVGEYILENEYTKEGRKTNAEYMQVDLGNRGQFYCLVSHHLLTGNGFGLRSSGRWKVRYGVRSCNKQFQCGLIVIR